MKKHATTAQINSLDKALWTMHTRADRLRAAWEKQNGVSDLDDLDATARAIADCISAISATCDEALGLLEEYAEEIDAEQRLEAAEDAPARTIPNTILWNRSVNQGSQSCNICGRDVGADPVGVIVVHGGASLVHPDDNVKEIADGGYMGWWPVGSECAKKVPAEYLTK